MSKPLINIHSKMEASKGNIQEFYQKQTFDCLHNSQCIFEYGTNITSAEHIN